MSGRWSWWLRWLEPHRAEDRKKLLFQCACGRIMWSNAPQHVRKHHLGHRMILCQQASVWNFVKMKLGLLNCRTLSEWLTDRMEKS